MNTASTPLPLVDKSLALAAVRSFPFVLANRPERFFNALA